MRPMFCSLLALAFASPALAGSELQLESKLPVVLLIDGASQGTAQPHEPLLIDIEAGVRNVRIQGLLGKDLYERDLIFDDHTRTEVVWQKKELRLGQVVALDPDRKPEPMDELPVVPEHPRVEGSPDVNAAPPPPPLPADAPLAKPVEPPAPPPPPPPTAAPADAPPAPPATHARTVAPPAATTTENGVLAVDAKEGMDLRITHGTKVLRVMVKAGSLVVVDGNGTEIVFSGDAQAW